METLSEVMMRLAKADEKKAPIVGMAEGLGYVVEGWSIEDYVKAAIEGTSFTGLTTPGFESIVIWGPMGTYKSNLAMQIAYKVYRDWDKVLEKVILTYDELIKIYKEAEESKVRIPLIILDDITTSLPKHLWFVNRKRFSDLQRLIAVIRSQFACIICTTPKPENVISSLAEVTKNEITTFPNGWALVNRYVWLPSKNPMAAKFKKIVIENRKIEPDKIPRDVFTRYDQKRNSVAKSIIKEMYGDKPTTKEFQKQKVLEQPIEKILDAVRSRGLTIKDHKAIEFIKILRQYEEELLTGATT